MTIRISLRAVAFVVYTLALLGGAFGISYAVFEWREDDSIERRVEAIEESRVLSERFDDEFCDIVLSIDGLVFGVADVMEVLGFHYEGETTSQTVRAFTFEHPIAPDFGC